MRVLVTGASGFIGTRVVAAFVREGHCVRALVRPSTDVDTLGWSRDVEVVRGDVRAPQSLKPALEDVDAVVHLAGTPAADPDVLFTAFVSGTEHLVAAMAEAGVRRLVLASSFAVYDTRALRGIVDEHAPLERDPYTREGYCTAKLWQERVVRQAATEHDLEVTILRPGLVWGDGHTDVGSLGLRIGAVQLLFGARTRLRLSFVDNCAWCFVAATLSREAIGETINVIDLDEVSAWRYAGALRRHAGRPGVRVVIPYRIAFACVWIGNRLALAILGPRARLPGVLDRRRFEARFKPLRYSAERMRDLFGGAPVISFEEAARSLALDGATT